MLVSSLADGCLLVAPICWIIVDQGLDLATADGLERATSQVLAVMTWAPLARLVALPLLAPLGDALHRGRVLSIALLSRAWPWLLLGLLVPEQPASLRS